MRRDMEEVDDRIGLRDRMCTVVERASMANDHFNQNHRLQSN